MENENNSPFEQWVINNRRELSQQVPTNNLWLHISQKIKRKGRSELWLWRAASVMLLCVSIYLGFEKLPINTQAAEYQSVDNNFNKVEQFYISQISDKWAQIDYFSQKSVELDESYLVDMQRLDAMYEVLKEEYQKKPSSQELKDALTLNLIVRINLLNKQLEKIEVKKLKKAV